MSKQCTNYIGTLNNPKMTAQEYLEQWVTRGKAVYAVGQLEKGEEGTVHIQFFLNFKKPGITIVGLKKFCSLAHFKEVRVNNGADNYCMKEDTRLEGPFEYGVKPVKHNSKKDWEEVKEKA